MIISHRHKYVFIEFPQTGCSAIGTELMANYNGERILFKHAQYQDFLKKASEEEKKYFSFSSVRNPMDIVVSKYFKYKNNHKGYIDKKVKHGKARKILMPGIEKGRRDYILKHNTSFEDFFLKYYRWPYSSWSLVDHKNMDFILRFENLESDFEKVIHRLNIDLVRPLPKFNATSEKEKVFYEYYTSRKSRERAIQIFKPYMDYWGYSFPEKWNVDTNIKGDIATYKFINSFRKLYWKYLR